MEYSRPTDGEYMPFFGRYVSLVKEDAILETLQQQRQTIQTVLGGLNETQAGFRYGPTKWSIREVVGHMIDAERIFGYRALSIARGEERSLYSFDENLFAANSNHDRYALPELIEEFASLRRSHVLMFKHMDDAAWHRVGRVNDHPTSTRGLAFIMAGHVRHHANVLSERYNLQITL
jgi:hypothetical protein